MAARTLASAPPAVAAAARAHAAAVVQKVAKSKPAGQNVSLKDVKQHRKAQAKAAEADKRAGWPKFDR